MDTIPTNDNETNNSATKPEENPLISERESLSVSASYCNPKTVVSTAVQTGEDPKASKTQKSRKEIPNDAIVIEGEIFGYHKNLPLPAGYRLDDTYGVSLYKENTFVSDDDGYHTRYVGKQKIKEIRSPKVKKKNFMQKSKITLKIDQVKKAFEKFRDNAMHCQYCGQKLRPNPSLVDIMSKSQEELFCCLNYQKNFLLFIEDYRESINVKKKEPEIPVPTETRKECISFSLSEKGKSDNSTLGDIKTKNLDKCWTHLYSSGAKMFESFSPLDYTIFYKSGQIAVISVECDNTSITQVFADDHKNSPVGVYNSSIGLVIYQEGNQFSAIKLLLNEHGGIQTFNNGKKMMRWSWTDSDAYGHVHAPPIRPIFIKIGHSMILRVNNYDDVVLMVFLNKRQLKISLPILPKKSESKKFSCPTKHQRFFGKMEYKLRFVKV